MKKIKTHFAFTYQNFGLHVIFLSALAGLFWYEDIYLLWFAGLLLIGYYYYRIALSQASFYFILCSVLYLYIAFGYVFVHLLDRFFAFNIEFAYAAIFYFIATALLAIWVLIRMNRKIKSIK